MANDFARRNMWDVDYRKEQLFSRDFLADLYPNWVFRLEYRMYNLTIDEKKYRNAVLDIAITNEKIAIRLNGGYHTGQQKVKDEFQKDALTQDGWWVIDFDHYMMPNLFKKNKNDETVKLAEVEIVNQLGKMSRL